MTRKLLPVLFTLFFFVANAQVNITVGPYLQCPTTNSVVIKWRTDSASTSKIMYGTDANNLNLSATDNAVTNWHTVKITGLTAYTRYYYAVYNDNTFAEGGDTQHTFKTFPVTGAPTHVRAWAIGDFGKGNSKQALVRDSYPFDNEETDLWLWLGDNVYDDGTEQEYLTKVFDSTYGFQKIMKSLPFEPAPGNHDYNSVSPVASPKPPLQHTGPYYDFVDVYTQGEAGGVATGHELFYSYNYGNVHFVSLNSELGSVFSANDDWTGVNPFATFNGSPMTQWLHQDLAANTLPWVVVYLHQPPYTDGSHDAGAFYEIYMKAIRENFAEIWEQYGVDLVLCGHSHVYERSYLVKGSYGDAGDITPFNYVQNTNGVDSMGQAFIKYSQGFNPNQGTVYVVCGNSGSSDDAPGFNHPYMYAEYGCDTCIGSFVLDVDSNRLDGRFLDAYGNIRDHFTIKKLNEADPNAVREVKPASFLSKLQVAPNPFSNKTMASFELLKSESLKITLSDAVGKVTSVYEGTLTKGAQEIEINAQQLKLAKGIYNLQISTGTQTEAKTLIIQ
ncbi:MAG TPA: metallophosphoesterase [Chitinophagales bacterium]|nr:metallophosphoesterase [Chitinophagales bacterium]